jgi:hypothetical protein
MTELELIAFFRKSPPYLLNHLQLELSSENEGVKR